MHPRIIITLFLGSLLATFAVQAQDTKDTTRARRPNRFAESIFADSGKLTQADYMQHIEDSYQVLHQVEIKSELGMNVRTLVKELAETDSALQVVSRVVNGNSSSLNVRNLQMFSLLLQHIQSDIKLHRAFIDTACKELLALKEDMRGLIKDTTMKSLFRDSVMRKAFAVQLKNLRGEWRGADSVWKLSFNFVNQLKTHTAGLSITATELAEKVDDQLHVASIKAFGKEGVYLWEASPEPNSAFANRELRRAYRDEKTALNYYFKDSGSRRFFLLLFGAVFLLWVHMNLRAVKKAGQKDVLSHYQISYLPAHLFASVFVLMFSLAPLFDLQAPAVYIESMQFFLLIALTFIFRKQWPRNLFLPWIAVVVLFVLFSLAEHAAYPSKMQRCLSVILNVLSIGTWLLFLFRLPVEFRLRRFIRVVLIVNIVLNVLAIGCNLYGRLSLSHIFRTTSIFSFTQAVGLSVFCTVFVEAILLQVLASRLKQGLQKHFDKKHVVTGFEKPLVGVVLLLWAIVFTTNLNIYNTLFDALADFLRLPRSIGSVTFSFGSVCLFCLIIWIAHMLQRYIGYFFGDIGAEDEQEGKGQRSRLLVTKLVLISAGYLLAVAASGLPVDRITIVLGALGVGIGMGLQNIVNNFVSGIILIFDRPLQIGDSVEVGDKLGKVKEIGLRSSTLFTPDGAEVIIPNGDILSQQIVNWTFSNDHKRLELGITVAGTIEKEKVEAIIMEVLAASPFVLQQRQPTILFEKIKGNTITLKLYFWCADVQKAELAKSSIHFLLYQRLSEKGLELQ
jgi:small-conductance mechanosensitive channel